VSVGSSTSAARASSFDLIVRAPTTAALTRRSTSPTLSNICTRLYAKAVASFATSIQVGKMLSRNLSAVTTRAAVSSFRTAALVSTTPTTIAARTRAIDPQFMSSYRIWLGMLAPYAEDGPPTS
jgi:hypothetical protein